MKIWLAFFAAVFFAMPAHAGSSVRYALIVANDHGVAPSGVVLADLEHAEREALVIRNRLVRLANFDDSADRVVVLRGKTRAEILAAAKALAEQHRDDRAVLGDVSTLFAFFFTGHGLEGKLLTRDAPLTPTDLAAIFQDMDATFTVGVFDACFSGSFDLESLKAKGLRATPGFNAFAELPQEVLSSQGTMWFVSSRPDQVSYEDNRLGGVFLHFFLDGMEKAPSDGFGVTLDEIWEYARARTQAYTSKTGRPQTPEKMVRNLKSSGPLYFSFLQERRATLVFDKEVAGHFVVRYDRSQLTEIFEKRAGHTAELPLYAADVVLERRRSTGEVDRQTLRLEPGARVRVRMRDGWSPAAGVGFLEEGFAKKGDVIADVVVTSRRPSLSLLVEGGYVAVAAPGYSAVSNHQAHLRSRFDYDRSAWGASFSYGQKEEDFPSWGYDLKRTELAVFGGPAWDLDLIRLGAELEAFASYGQVRYRNTETRDLFGFGAGVAGTALLRLWEGPLGVYLSGRLGARSENVGVVAPIDGDKIWAFEPLVFLGISLRVL